MTCTLIQTDYVPADNRAEKVLLDFLKNLPDEYYVYRELKLTPAYMERVRGIDKKQPDFVVVSPAVGVLSIEVKDWNLIRNTYRWLDQQKVIVEGPNGVEKKIDNPVHQADSYLHAFQDLLKGMGVFVSSALAFPRLTRQEFLNRLHNIEVLQNPQSRYYLDLTRTIFKEDLDEFFHSPESVLLRLVRTDSKFRSSTEREIESVHQRLMPNAFRIGDFTARQEQRKRLRIITEQQQRWIFNLDDRASYLLDVAGSGKTNALVSKAVHIVDTALKARRPPPRILLTTYSENLTTNIRRIRDSKIPKSDQQKYRSSIHVHSLPALMRRIVVRGYDLETEAEYDKPGETVAEYEKRLREDVKEVLKAMPEQFREFDYIFIDEIQDFDNLYLLVVKHLCRTDNYFFVGDIGQKIYDRAYDLHRLGLVVHDIELPKSYKMFRTPKYIAELATRFICADAHVRYEFEKHGYREDFQFANQDGSAAVLMRAASQTEAVVERISDYLAKSYAEDDLLVVTSSRRVGDLQAALEASNIRCTIGETGQSGVVIIVDFMKVKGLERATVMVCGVEDLYHRESDAALFEDVEIARKQEALSRRLIYIALTRSLEELTLFYSDEGNPFISELIQFNRKILAKRESNIYVLSL